jgi:soluble lytic murein transglycosylase
MESLGQVLIVQLLVTCPIPRQPRAIHRHHFGIKPPATGPFLAVNHGKGRGMVMGKVAKYKFGKCIRKLLILSGVLSVTVTAADPIVEASAKRIEDSKMPDKRVLHARELLGQYYHKSIVQAGERVSDIATYVRVAVRKKLKPRWKAHSEAIVTTLMTESQRYGFDPLFVVALIEAESGFNPGMRGSKGEVGLMQVKPSTATWIGSRKKLEGYLTFSDGLNTQNLDAEQLLEDPHTNLRYGIAYLAYLREKFAADSRLYVAAYNMGIRNVLRVREKQLWPKTYSDRVMKKYVDLYEDLQGTFQTVASL